VPLIAEWQANFQRRPHDDALVERYNVFIFEVVKAHVAPPPKHPETLHYTVVGVFAAKKMAVARWGEPATASVRASIWGQIAARRFSLTRRYTVVLRREASGYTHPVRPRLSPSDRRPCAPGRRQGSPST